MDEVVCKSDCYGTLTPKSAAGIPLVDPVITAMTTAVIITTVPVSIINVS